MELIKKYFPNLMTNQLNQLFYLKDLYKYWNFFINVISRKTSYNYDFYQNHVLFCLSIAKIFSFKSGSKIMDLGTGGGFPGIPLSILFPNSQFILVDSIRKKIKVVKKIVSYLNIKNVYPICIRAEKIDQKFDFIVTRGVAKINIIQNWIKNKFKKKYTIQNKTGTLYLKGGDLSEEKNTFPYAMEYSLKEYFEEPFFFDKKIVWIPNI
ncbi:16S rRNA (guanine(527)-N(7))-methyltransferase RsmG [Blattabacterium cuenoti]|uniref:16S rRNA (guanine(527)-N(7))-methyltransferase RsmG n=1 Tax=Blattabacterium cuenoti TaxID=1653831 RepID=UPI00163CC31E|nr:16S rRNA (guanine(527)-N(7))-methyltransferase RsmG [Blattabacterium cuenoti]